MSFLGPRAARRPRLSARLRCRSPCGEPPFGAVGRQVRRAGRHGLAARTRGRLVDRTGVPRRRRDLGLRGADPHRRAAHGQGREERIGSRQPGCGPPRRNARSPASRPSGRGGRTSRRCAPTARPGPWRFVVETALTGRALTLPAPDDTRLGPRNVGRDRGHRRAARADGLHGAGGGSRDALGRPTRRRCARGSHRSSHSGNPARTARSSRAWSASRPSRRRSSTPRPCPPAGSTATTGRPTSSSTTRPR